MVVTIGSLRHLCTLIDQFFCQLFLLSLRLDPLLFEFLLDIHDLFLFAGQLATDFHDFTLELLLELDNAFFTTLQVCCLLSNLALKACHPLNSLVEGLFPLGLFHFPITSHFLDLLNLLLLQVRQKLGHLSSLPHFKLPDDLLFNRVLAALALPASTAAHCGSLHVFLLLAAANFFLTRDAHVLQVEHYAKESLDLPTLLDLEVFVTDDEHRCHGAFLLAFL